MQGGVIRSICLLTFLLSTIGQAEELYRLKELESHPDAEDQIKVIEAVDLKESRESSNDLKDEVALADLSPQNDVERSGSVAQSSSHGNTGSSISKAVANTYGGSGYSGGSALAYSDGFGSSTQSKATAAVGLPSQTSQLSSIGPEYSHYLSSGNSFSHAGAESSNGGGSPYVQGLNSFLLPSSYPYSPGFSSSQAQAQGDVVYFPPASLATPVSSMYNQGVAQADDAFYQPIPKMNPNMNTYNKESGFYSPSYIPPPNLKQESSYTQMQALPEGADAAPTNIQGFIPYGLDYPLESLNPLGGNAQGPYNIYPSDQNSALAFEDAKSRLILPHEYVFPNKIPGGENVVQCLKENEFHHFWSQGFDCLVCICLNEYGLLTPVCASCGGCYNAPQKLPEPLPSPPGPITIQPPTPPFPQPEPNPSNNQPFTRPDPYPYPETIPTLPTPTVEATCNPLPSGQPFTNPLHPCQICICRESYISGRPDVQIQCKDNPQCISPADVTTLPPIPDVPVPIPLPMCEKFPEHVLFPHPTDGCKLCKCSKHLAESGVPEQHITCYPHPDCVPKVEPIPETETLVPPHLHLPIESNQNKAYPELTPELIQPVPLPEIVPIEPLPWPPIPPNALVPTTPMTVPVLTPRPGPLPGPSPHESCHPYPPNQAFQHPWDECQVCMCTEAYAVGMTNVEVNCYTKQSCCIEPPDLLLPVPAITGYSKPHPGISTAVNGLDIQSLENGPQPNILATSTYRPAPMFPPFNPRPVNIYPGNTQPQGYRPSYSRPKSDEVFGNPPSTYPHQPNYHPGYGSPQYPEYPARLPPPSGPFKPSNYGYAGNYQYSQGDVGNSYLGPPEPYQPYEHRYQGVPAPNVYPPIYPRYEAPQMYPTGQIRDSFASAQASAQGGSSAQSFAQTYDALRSKTGTDGAEDADDT